MSYASSSQPKALFFDVFGTTVNWHPPVTACLSSHASAILSSPTTSIPSTLRFKASTTSWSTFALAWRQSYGIFTQFHSDHSNPPTKTIDEHHHDSLVQLLDERGLKGLFPPDQILEISRVWHFLDPWPDSSEGVRVLNAQGIQTVALSNGNRSLLSDMAEYAHLPWTHILSAFEDFGAYKPSFKVYLGAVEKLRLDPGECGMVAAHLGDLKAAKECGLRTIYIEREGEENFSREEIEQAREWVNMWVGLGEGGTEEVGRRLKEGKQSG